MAAREGKAEQVQMTVEPMMVADQRVVMEVAGVVPWAEVAEEEEEMETMEEVAAEDDLVFPCAYRKDNRRWQGSR